PRTAGLDSDQVREARNEPAPLLRLVDQVVLLVAPRDHALEVDAPHAILAPLGAELGEGNSHLQRPALRIDVRLGLPDTVPRIVIPAIVVERAVVMSAGGVHHEVIAGATVVIRIEGDAEAIRGDRHVAATWPREDRGGER